MNLLNFVNILGENANPIVIGLLYLMPILIVSISFGVNPKKPIAIFLYSFFLFLFLIVLFKFTIPVNIIEGGGIFSEDIKSKLKQFEQSLDQEIRLPISYTILIGVFLYILFSFVILFNTNRKNKAKYFFLNLIIQYSLFINLLILVYMK